VNVYIAITVIRHNKAPQKEKQIQQEYFFPKVKM